MSDSFVKLLFGSGLSGFGLFGSELFGFGLFGFGLFGTHENYNKIEASKIEYKKL